MAWLTTDNMACELGNDRISVRFGADGKATSVVVDGRELLVNLSGAAGDPDRDHSFYCDYHVNQKTRNLVPTRLEVLSNTPEVAHVAYVDDASDLKLAYHLVVAGDAPAVYGYVVAWADVPGVVVNELRTVYRFDSTLFTTGYTAKRQGLQPRAEYMAEHGEKLQDETFRFPEAVRYSNSDVYSKYDYAGYFADNDVWGQWSGGRTDDEWGAWFIPMDKSAYPGGPLKQELLVHYDSIILNYMTGAHFGTGDFEVEAGWKKLYGPWCMYFNHGGDVVSDALAHAEAEKGALPVAWLDEPGLYDGAYASLAGSIVLACPVENARGWTVTASDAPGDVFHQKAGRIYYAQTDGDSFELAGMQPGHYWLRARRNETTDAEDYDLGEFDLVGGQCLDADVLRVENRVRPLVWSIGTRTGTTAPFKFSDQQRNYVWMGLVPKNLVYEVGADAPEDWYYLQRYEGAWRIRFAKPAERAKKYLLTVCLAGTTLAQMIPGQADVRFRVALNGSEVANELYENDRAAYRSSVTGGAPQKLEIEVPAELLGDTNEIVFTTDGYVMYDMIKLEVLG